MVEYGLAVRFRRLVGAMSLDRLGQGILMSAKITHQAEIDYLSEEIYQRETDIRCTNLGGELPTKR